MQGIVKGGRRQGRQRNRWEDNIGKWTGLEFGKSQRAVKNRGKWRKLIAKLSVVTPTTLAVKGLMMMMIRFARLGILIYDLERCEKIGQLKPC